MRKIISALTAVALTVSVIAVSTVKAEAAPKTNVSKTASTSNEVVVKFKDSFSIQSKNQFYKENNMKVIFQNKELGFDVIEVKGKKGEQLVKELKANPNVEYVEPNIEVKGSSIPNDQYFPFQYGLQLIKAPEAWKISKGDDVIVAVLDTGVEMDHPDLKDNLLPGYDFVDGDLDPNEEPGPSQGHGTHVAGIIAAVTNNGIGVAGVAPNAKILPLRVLDPTEKGKNYHIAAAIVMAVNRGAKVINMSFGIEERSLVMEAAVKYAAQRGVVLVGSAGNLGWSEPHYPAYYKEVIAVAATDHLDKKADFSNHGHWVDVAAPGVEVASTVHSGGYWIVSGTSMSAPHVSGVAALLASMGANAKEIRYYIESTADPIEGTGVYWTHGRVNALEAVKKAQRMGRVKY